MHFKMIIGMLVLLRIILFVFFVTAEGQYIEEDSGYYIWLADILREHHVFSQDSKPPFIPQVFRTPGYPVFLALIKSLGMISPYWVVFWQELIYGASCFVFYHFAQKIFTKSVTRAGLIFLLLEPGGLATPKMVLSETLFLPFFLAGMLAIAYYLRDKNWRYLMLAGFLMGLGAFVRPAIVYFPLLVAFVLLFCNLQNGKKYLHITLFLLVFVLSISPWLYRNYYYFGKVFMSGQQSSMLANYHVPIVWESAKGLPFWQGHALIKQQVNQAVASESENIQRSLTTVERFTVEQRLAIEELSQYPFHYLKQWCFGILKTMNGANLLQLYHAYNYRSARLRFFAIKATDFSQKVYIFLLNQDYFYIFEVLLRVLIGGFALLGAGRIITAKNCFLWVVMLANFYFICTPGPMGYARFRFPVEVFWLFQAYIGYGWVFSYLRKAEPAIWNDVNSESE